MGNVNTFQQFDQFEVLTSAVAKNRVIYDFSHSGANIAKPSIGSFGSNEISNQVVWNVRGKATQINNHNQGQTTPATSPRTIIFGDPILSNPYSGQSYYRSSSSTDLSATVTSLYPLGLDNGTEKLVPIIEDNALIQLNYYGTSSTTPLPTSFRSGYIEFSFKTSKQNCIIAYGAGSVVNPQITNIQSSNYLSDDKNSDLNKLTINVVNGKLNLTYIDENGTNATSFTILGNKTVADGQWHHAVINFTRPGLIKGHSDKIDKKSIEFWIDGKLDKRSFENSEQQVFFPEITHLAADPTTWATINGNEFNGSIRTFASGINFPLDLFEIQTRYKYWNYDELPEKPALLASASMGDAQVSVNKTRALKLFWKDIINKNGIELDNNYIVDSYCITHKNKNSITETYNVDLAKKTTKKVLTNVRIALTDNILIWGPGSVSPQNIKTPTGTGRLTTQQGDPNQISEYSGFAGSLLDLTFSGVDLNTGDRILLTNQIRPEENGIWIFNGKSNPLTRANDADSSTKINDAIVYVTEGYYSETYWTIESNINSFTQAQKWVKLDSRPETTINSQPFFTSRWSDEYGNERFIDLENDISLSNYDLIVFMNYPDTFEEITQSLDNSTSAKFMYDSFIKSLKNLVVYGAKLYVSSEMLAGDLGLVREFEKVDQAVETSDAQSAAISPFEASEAAEMYFDTHRLNKYHLATEVPGLTNKATYILTDFISYESEDSTTEYHAKYVSKPLGIQEGNEFLISGLALNSFTENDKLPGYRENNRGTKPLSVIEPADILYGTPVTKMQNTYYLGDTAVSNPHDDKVTTLIVNTGDSFDGRQILGKIFLNVIEDGYTMSREEYNKATIQVIPVGDVSETTQTRAWQYSTSRLNREPRKINVRELTRYGQTKPTLGGGGPLIQAASSSSNGIIRTQTDSDNINYQSDLYSSESEEIYEIQEIPVLSMTYLGLQWLAE